MANEIEKLKSGDTDYTLIASNIKTSATGTAGQFLKLNTPEGESTLPVYEWATVTTEIPAPTGSTRGGVKAAARDASTDTNECKLGTDGKLYCAAVTGGQYTGSFPINVSGTVISMAVAYGDVGKYLKAVEDTSTTPSTYKAEWATVSSGSSTLADLTDVSIQGTPSVGQALVYRSVPDVGDRWTNDVLTTADISGLDTVLAAKASTSDLNQHVNNGTIHVTENNKSAWDAKQNALTVGDNISITNNRISATDTTYTNGTGLNLNGTTFSLAVPTANTIGGVKAGTNITIGNDGTISATGGGGGTTYTFNTPLYIGTNNNVYISAATATEVEEEGMVVISGTDGYLTKEDKNKLNHLDLGSGATGYYYALTYNTEYGLWNTTIFSVEQPGTRVNNVNGSIQAVNNYSSYVYDESMIIGPSNGFVNYGSVLLCGYNNNVFGTCSTVIASNSSNVWGSYSADIAGNNNDITNGACLVSSNDTIDNGVSIKGSNNVITNGVILSGKNNTIIGKSKHDIIIGGYNNTINNEYDDNNIIIGGSNNAIKTYAANSVLLASRYGSTNQRGVIANQYNPKKFSDNMKFHTGFKGVRPVWSTAYSRTTTPLLENVHTAIVNLQVIAYGSYDWSDSSTWTSGSESDNFILETSTVLIRNGAVYQQQSESLKDDYKVTPVFKCFIEDGDLHIKVYTDYWNLQYLGVPNQDWSDSMSAYTAITRDVHALDIDWIDCGVWYTMYSLSDESDSSSSSSN